MNRACVRNTCTWLVLVAMVLNGEAPLFARAGQADPASTICSVHAKDSSPDPGGPTGLPNRNGKSLRCLLCCLVPDRGVADSPKVLGVVASLGEAGSSPATGRYAPVRESPSRSPAPPRAPPPAA